MNSWTETTYLLSDDDHPSVIPITKQRRVMLNLPGYASNCQRQGFTLSFTPSHIPMLEKLLAELYTACHVDPPRPENYRFAIELTPNGSSPQPVVNHQ